MQRNRPTARQAIWLRTIFVSLLIIQASGCHTTNYAQNGALLGGLTGAGVGAAVGNSHDQSAAGALIGGAVGALTGSAIGGSLDEIDARNQALIEQSVGRRLAGATTIGDTIAMSRAGLSDPIIVQHLRSHGLASSLDSEDLITLKQQGVSDGVIAAMQSMHQQPPVALATYEEPLYISRTPRVIVREPLYSRPCPPPYWRQRHLHRPHGVHWGVSFSN